MFYFVRSALVSLRRMTYGSSSGGAKNYVGGFSGIKKWDLLSEFLL